MAARVETGMDVLAAPEIEEGMAMVSPGAPDTEMGPEAARSSSKRHGEGSEGVASNWGEAKRQRGGDGDDEEEEEPDPYCYRELFEWFWAYRGGKFDDITRGPMSHTDDAEKSGSRMYPCLEIYSCKVTDLKGLEWPIHVFGLVAVHDSLDRKRNYIFNRERNDAQLLTAEDSSLVLTGPIRAIDCHQRIEFEVDLKVPGKRQSKDKVLSTRYFVYETMGPGCRVGQVLTKKSEVKRCTIELKFGHFAKAVEATIEVKIIQGSSNFHGRFIAQTDSFNEEVVLLDSGDGLVPVTADGVIKLSRRVVIVDGTGVLDLRVVAWKGHCWKIFAKDTAKEDGNNLINGVDVTREDHAKFTAQTLKRSSGTLDVGFCKMVATICWSLIPLL